TSGLVSVNSGDSTSTTVACATNPVEISNATVCTAIVTDTTSGSVTPTGRVTFSSTGTGSFDSTGCVLAGGACVVTYTADATVAMPTIAATYSGDVLGDSTLGGSSGNTVLTVQTSAATLTPTPTATSTSTPTATASPI